MQALQVAALGDIPDHHWLFIGGKLQQMGRQVPGAAVVAQHVAGFHRAAV
jgi:hypothetical protein